MATVLIVDDSPTEIHVLKTMLEKNGFDVSVVTNVTDHAKPIIDAGFNLIPIKLVRRNVSPVRELRTLVQLYKIYKQVQPDIVHYMKRCGFDTFQMPEGRPLPPVEKNTGGTIAPYSDYYQASVLEPEPAYRRNRRGA